MENKEIILNIKDEALLEEALKEHKQGKTISLENLRKEKDFINWSVDLGKKAKKGRLISLNKTILK